MPKIVQKKDGTPIAYVGRDGKTYVLHDNFVNVAKDAPGEEKCLTVILVKDGLITMAAHTDEGFLIEMSKETDIVDEAGNKVEYLVN